jgi:hypothetical protein
LQNDGSIFSHVKTEKLNIRISVVRTKLHGFRACVEKIILDPDAPFELHDVEPLLWSMRTKKKNLVKNPTRIVSRVETAGK